MPTKRISLARTKAAEDEAGLPLLHRTRHGVTLTSAGATCPVSAQGVLASAQRALHEVLALKGTLSGRVVPGIPPMLGEHLLVALIRRFREECPAVKLHIREGIGGDVMEWLMTRQVDVVVVERGMLGLRPIGDPRLRGIFSAGMTTQRPLTAAMRALFNALRRETRKLAIDGVWRSFDAAGMAGHPPS